MRKRGFTLVELLVVLILIALLVALLVPVVSGVWQSALMTWCQHNLSVMFQAQNVWRAERNSLTFTGGRGWQGALMPYVENRQSVFICPASLADATMGEDVGTTLYFVIHALPNATPGATPISAYPITIPLANQGSWAKIVTKTLEYERWHVDDGEHLVAGGGGGDDIQFEIHYEGDVPAWIQTFPGSSSSRYEYRYEFYINGECFTRDWFNEYAIGSKKFDLPQQFAGGCDYGLSKGTFEVDGRTIQRVDSRLILILDYPRLVANYSSSVGGGDPWDKYFIRDGDAWMAKYRSILREEQTWRHYQSLRHFGKANVLFCEGHVRALGPEELYETNPAWRYAEN